MRILNTVEFYDPIKGGAQEVVRQISERLSRRGHQVAVATTKVPDRKFVSLNGVQIVDFDISGNFVRGFRGEIDRYQQFLLDGNFDVMLNYAAQQWTADLAFSLLDRLPYRKVLVPCGFSGLFFPSYAPYFEQMPDFLRRYDRLVFHSSTYRDIEFARQNGLDNLSVIPNGAAQEEFNSDYGMSFREKYHIPFGSPFLLTVGSHTGQKGHRLVIESFRRADLPGAYLVVIGNVVGPNNCLGDCRRRAARVNLFSFGRKRVLLLDLPRKEVVAAFQAADLFVFGSNIEYSPLVLFEALASKTPFVSLACGNAAEIAEWSGGGVIVDSEQKPFGRVDASPQAFACAVEDILSNPEKRQKMAEAGYRCWQDRFTWDKITDQYEELFLKIRGK